MTAPPLPLGDRLPQPRPPCPDLELQALRDECDALRARLGDLQQRFEKLSLDLRHWEEVRAPRRAAAPPAAEPVGEAAAPATRGEEPPTLRDLIDAMVRGADGPSAGPSAARRVLAGRGERPFRRGLSRLARWPRALGWLTALGLVLLLAAAALRFLF